VHSHSKTVCGETQGIARPMPRLAPVTNTASAMRFLLGKNKDAGIVIVPSGGQGTRPWRHDVRGRFCFGGISATRADVEKAGKAATDEKFA